MMLSYASYVVKESVTNILYMLQNVSVLLLMSMALHCVTILELGTANQLASFKLFETFILL